METEMISLNEFCAGHEVEISFVQSLEDHGLVEIVIINQTLCVHANDLPKLERIVRLHHELNINPEGIDVIDHLLNRMKEMEHEITALRNQLHFFEKENDADPV
jgi:hypothetical protein